MERIGHVTGQDPWAVRLANLAARHEDMRDLAAAFRRQCDYERRLRSAERFNRENAWRKRALRVSLMAFPIQYAGPFSAALSVYYGDGSVLLSHAGVEMGQGINTKVAQVCAHALDVPLAKVAVRGTTTFVASFRECDYRFLLFLQV